ncbi:MAG: hypothetical protein ABJZ55_02005 [Fuerstiella sp.]
MTKKKSNLDQDKPEEGEAGSAAGTSNPSPEPPPLSDAKQIDKAKAPPPFGVSFAKTKSKLPV